MTVFSSTAIDPPIGHQNDRLHPAGADTDFQLHPLQQGSCFGPIDLIYKEDGTNAQLYIIWV